MSTSVYKHGVYVNEKSTSLTIPNESVAGLQVVFGTAPVNLGDPTCVNTPIIAYSFAEAVKKLGYSDSFDKFTLCQAMDASFRVFNVAPVIFVNVLDPTKAEHKESLSETPSVIGGKAIIEEEGILQDGLTVLNGSTELELDEDYTLSFNDNGYLVITLASIVTPAPSSLTVSGYKLKPTGVTASDIVGSVDANTGIEKGLELIRKIYPTFGLNVGIINAPGWSHNATVAAAMQAKCININGCFACECLIDIPSDSANGAVIYSGVNTVKQSIGVDDEHAYALWPMVQVGTKKYYYSAIMGACIAQTDAENGDVPSASPSNKDINITATVLADGTEVVLDQEQANLVNSFGVTTAINSNGFKSWGNNTAAYPSTTDPKDRWLAVRRFFSWWGNNFIRRYFQRVDDPTNYRLIESVVDSENIIGNGYVARGYCAEAKVKFIPNENPITDILNGTIRFHTFLAPYTPAESIENVLEFDPTAITEALNGGEE